MLPRLTWDMHANPIANTVTPWERCLSALPVTEASFTTLADGGFGPATFTVEDVPFALIEEALTEWTMKRVTVTDGAAEMPWEGFVFEIEADNGYHTYVRSVDAFYNRAFVVYTFAGGSCKAGATCPGREQLNETDIDVTYDTQSRIGIKETWLDFSQNVTTQTIANAYGKNRLAQVLQPMTGSFDLGSGADWKKNRLTLTLNGAFATLQWRKQTTKYPGTTGLREISAVLKNALTVGAKAQYLETNGYTFPQMNTTGRSLTEFNAGGSPMWLQDYVLEAIAPGDSAGRRVFFQVLPGRIPTLFRRSTAPVYFTTSGDWRAFNADKGSVPAYLVKAGGYLQVENLTAPLDVTSDVIGRGQAALVEQTTYDALQDRLNIPPASDLLSVKRMWARQMRQGRGKR